MWRWLRNTKLAIQLQQIVSEHRSLRQAQHRHSLRIKRAAVRSRILYEIHTKQIQQLGIQILSAKLLKKYRLTKSIIAAYEERERKLQTILSRHGIHMPQKTRPQKQNDAEKGFKARFFANVETIISDHGGVVGKTLAKDALIESFDKLRLRGDEKDMAVGLVVGVAREIGLTKHELNDLFKLVERDGDDVGLRSAVFEALERDTKENNTSSSSP